MQCQIPFCAHKLLGHMPHIILPGVNMVQTNYTPPKISEGFWETKLKEECKMKKKQQTFANYL